ncbi:uncharacterized protein N7483_007802 [Penicillium malachiteum]|uniref:uncharacterized protein n=1 Tax=Penicillium malachiteum TaxID=1324776 RepID=UPI0025491EAD|nr:uncharacterized protein N7483_007802 [Penicillium malachiteum]KAJ5726445.1 hypothetical protein N7483_007802 [Penicillium malachiteum]
MSALFRGDVVLRSSIRPQKTILIPSHNLFSTSTIYRSQPIPKSGLLKGLFTIARAYLSFYKSGIFNVYHNYRASIPIRRTLGLSILIPTSPPYNISRLRSLKSNTQSSSPTSNASPTSKENETVVGRAQYQLTHRSALDIRRLIPFAAIVAICGEFTPLLLPYLGKSITPSTCRIPDQLHKEREKAIALKLFTLHAQAYLDKVPCPVEGSREEIRYIMKYLNVDWVRKADNDAVLRACAVLKLSTTYERRNWIGADFGVFWDFLVFASLRPRLLRHVNYLETDDALIRQAGGPSQLNEKELQLAVEERGAVDVGWGLGEKAEGVRKDWLMMWLEERSEH